MLGACSFAETVYSLHTFVAVVSKMVAAEVLAIQKQRDDLRPTQWRHLNSSDLSARLDELEAGQLSEQLGAPGLLQSDLFAWYAQDARSRPALLGSIRTLLEQLAQLAWAEVANAGGLRIDLLRDLYQAIVPRQLRKALGEFFTPRWLAERVLLRGLEECEALGISDPVLPRLLDPACGSGTFLVAAMRVGLERLDLRSEGSDADALATLIDRIVGIDVNPVSALMSRVNLLLALGDRAHFLPAVAFQVYQADSIVMPRLAVGQLRLDSPGEQILVPTSAADFRIPRALVTAERMSILRENLESSLRSATAPELMWTALGAELRASGLQASELNQIQPGVMQLYDQLSQLRDEGKDDVWARLLEQAIAPFLLDPFSLVVGNPPWVSWKDLPEAWKSRSEPVWRGWGLWNTRTRRQGLPLSDISTLMLARAFATYAPHGVVAMLLPKSVQLADPSGNAFRRSHLQSGSSDYPIDGTHVDIPYRVLGIDDFVAVNPFSPDASNQTIALYGAANLSPSFPIPIKTFQRAPRSRIKPEWGWQRAVQQLHLTEGGLTPVDAADIESPWALVPRGRSLSLSTTRSAYSFGRGFETRGLDGLFTFEILTPMPSAHRRQVRVRNMPTEGRNTAHMEPREGVVEPGLLWPLIKGEDVTRWKASATDRYLFVPYEVTTSQATPITVSDCATRFPRFFRYLQPWIEQYSARSMYQGGLTEDFPWELSGPIVHLADSGALVFVRYLATGARPAAAVRTPRYDERLGRTTLPLPNNKSNIFYTETTDEAYFLAAIINSSPIQNALSRFAVSTGVTPAAMSRLPIPVFDGSDRRHAALAALSLQAAHLMETDDLAAGEVAQLESQMDELVWDVAGPAASETSAS